MTQQKNILLRATVTEVVTGGVKLRFDGELAARQKTYAYMGGAPSVDDKVCLASMSGTYVVLGVFGGAGGGDVTGPAGATAGNIPVFLDATGKVLGDSGKVAASIVTGPSSAVNARLAAFDGTTGKAIKDSGIATSSIPIISTGTWTPSVTPYGGALGSYSILQANYIRINNLVYVTVDILISNVGTGTAPLYFTLPFNANGQYILHGRENALTGYELQGLAGTNRVAIYTYNNGPVLANGAEIIMSGIYGAI